MSKKIFLKHESVGTLYYEQIVLETSIPILFTARSENNVLYLVVRCGYEDWLMSEVSPEIIIEMLSDKITIREAFLEHEGERICIARDNGRMVVHSEDKKWHRCLPDDEYINADEDEFQEIINFYKGEK